MHHVRANAPPPCLQSVGKLRQEVAEQLGLGADVAVAPGSGDNQMSALGAGAVKVRQSSGMPGACCESSESAVCLEHQI